MASKTLLFETTHEAQPDGSFIVKPKRLADGREISAKAAAGMLGYRDRETVYAMIASGEIKGWKPATRRGNGKYRIDLASVIAYKESRLKAARSWGDSD
jgi:excisionase family DNA binding protein